MGGDIKTNTAGDVFAFWGSGEGSAPGEGTLWAAKSVDGGVKFSTPAPVGKTTSVGSIHVPACSDRGAFVNICGGAYRTATQSLVYAVWADLVGGTQEPGSDVASPAKTRIWFARSTNGGAKWEKPILIHDRASLNDQFHPRLAVDETSGVMVVIYYDTVADPGRVRTDVWMQSSVDDGATWSTPAKVTSAQSHEPPVPGSFQYGDYIGLTGHAGSFFACWTDRRTKGLSEIWGAPITPPAFRFVIDRDTYGQDDIDALRPQPGGAVIRKAFWVFVDGFTAGDLGVTGPHSVGGAPSVPAPAGMTIKPSGVDWAGPLRTNEVQTFRYAYDVGFPDDKAFGFAGQSETLTLTATRGRVSASAQITLLKQPDPYILHGEEWYLSTDMRVFQIASGRSLFGVQMNNDPHDFLSRVLANLDAGQGKSGGNSFDGIKIDEQTETLTLAPANRAGHRVFNFALARVRFRGEHLPAAAVRVFFRLFNAQTTATDFQPSTTYRSFSDGATGGHKIPLLGIRGGSGSDYTSLPCFAAPRVDASQVSLTTQTDALNRRDLPATGGPELDTFFGCLLDINDATPRLPVTVPPSNVDGPFAASTLQAVGRSFVRNPHQCLIAEIAFDPVPIAVGATPSRSDKIAQRNLAFSNQANPGIASSRRAVETFEINPTPASAGQGERPVELMIDWADMPPDQEARIYLPGVDADTVLAIAGPLYAAHDLQRADAHTLAFTTGGFSMMPLPPSTSGNLAGLLSVRLPDTIRKGQQFTITVRQVTTASAEAPIIFDPKTAAAGPGEFQWRRVVGTFQVTVPVSTKEALLDPEEQLLSILRWIQQGIPQPSQWYPVFERYIDQIAGRVSGLGGNPDLIGPSPTGDGRKRHLEPDDDQRRGEQRRHFTGKITGLVSDQFGDFCGFLLDTEDGERRFVSHEKDMASLADHAWRERLRITVITERDEPHRPLEIVLREPSLPLAP